MKTQTEKGPKCGQEFKTQGAARKKTKTVSEMRKNAAAARRNAQEADKASAKRKAQKRAGKV